jgi:hypothetical protein
MDCYHSVIAQSHCLVVNLLSRNAAPVTDPQTCTWYERALHIDLRCVCTRTYDVYKLAAAAPRRHDTHNEQSPADEKAAEHRNQRAKRRQQVHLATCQCAVVDE